MNKGVIIALVVVGSVLLLCVGGGAAIFYFVFRATAPMVQAADQFLVQIAEGKVDDAYNSAAAGLKSVQTREAFAASVKDMGLTEYASSTWNNRQITNDQGSVEGSITTKAGGTIPLKITLVKEGDVWRVVSVSGQKRGVSTEKK